jgi:hypothetical protein
VGGVFLVDIVGRFIGKNQCQPKVITMVDNRSASFCGAANVSRGNGVDAGKDFKARVEGIVVSLFSWVLEPEEYCVYKHGYWGFELLVFF